MNPQPDPPDALTDERLLEMSRGYQSAAVLAAAADLDLFDALANGPRRLDDLSHALACAPRGLEVLLDALAALDLLVKRDDTYALPPGARDWLVAGAPGTVLPMLQHQANCMRRWAQLARVVKSGQPADRVPSVRGEAKDLEAFIGGMHTLAQRSAARVIGAIQPPEFRVLLDLGGASGTWTAAFLEACPGARAILFDRPEVLPLARRRMAAAGLTDHVELVGGDFMTDALPAGADLVWVSAIVHQNSRAQNRNLFARIRRSLVAGGRIAIRDIVMDADRTQPRAGALFAVNMLVATEGGGTFTFEELRQDLQSAGFEAVTLARQDEGMNAVVVARCAG
jgi:precorrin-6B methylase 2